MSIWDNELIVFGSAISIIILSFIGVISGITWIIAQTSAGQKYDVDIIVQAVERSSRFGEHTNVWVQVYGDQEITYKLVGYQYFEVGKKYHLTFIDETWTVYYILFETRGRVEKIEEMKT